MNKIFICFILVAGSLFGDAFDPYKWLEEESTTQKEWLEEQKSKTNQYFSTISTRDAIAKHLSQIASFETLDAPKEKNGTLYYLKQRACDNKSVLMRQENAVEEVLVNPNQSEEEVNLIGFTVSPDGSKLAYGVSLAGSDQRVWRILDLHTKKHFPEKLNQIQFSNVHWDEKGDALYYVRNCKQIFRHKIGSDTSEDTFIYEGCSEHLIFDSIPVFGGQFLLTMERPWVVNNKRFILIDLCGDFSGPKHSVYELIAPTDAEVSFVGEAEDRLFFITDENCCFNKLITIDLNSKSVKIEEKESLLESAEIVAGHLVCVYYTNAIAKIKIFDLQGKFLQDVPLPGQGSVSLFSTKDSPILFYSYADFKNPTRFYSYNFETKEHHLFFSPTLSFDPDSFITEQKWYVSKDGTSVPLFLTYKKGLSINKNTPVLLYGYGGFGISMIPHFRSDFMGWLQSGGVLAVANLRGGREFGKKWYDQGRQFHKQNVFDDCICAAEYLIENKIGNPSSLSLFGTSNGGLLAGACLTQRPDLFKAVIVNKGVLDMLRFHLFTIGKYWVCDYGNPDNPEESAYLMRYSPYHNVKNGTHYPAVLVNTADHDDRVVPIHSYKFAAALQAANAGANPIMLRLEKSCGHGGKNSKNQEIAFGADMLSFLLNAVQQTQ